MNETEERAKYASLIERRAEFEKYATDAANELWKFMDDRAERGILKPYEICGAVDGGDRSHLECQLPKGHKDLGYRYHLEMRNGQVWGSWS